MTDELKLTIRPEPPNPDAMLRFSSIRSRLRRYGWQCPRIENKADGGKV